MIFYDILDVITGQNRISVRRPQHTDLAPPPSLALRATAPFATPSYATVAWFYRYTF